MELCIRPLYTSTSEMECKISRTKFLYLWLRSTVVIPGIVSSFATLFKKLNYKEITKNYKNRKLQLFHNKQRCCQNYTIRTFCHPVSEIFMFLSAINIFFWCYNEIHPNSIITTSVYVQPRLKR